VWYQPSARSRVLRYRKEMTIHYESPVLSPAAVGSVWRKSAAWEVVHPLLSMLPAVLRPRKLESGI
jgi:hypothetical protein